VKKSFRTFLKPQTFYHRFVSRLNSQFTLEQRGSGAREWSAAAERGSGERQRRAASSTENFTVELFTLAAALSVPLKWMSASTNPAAQCRYELMLHALFFQVDRHSDQSEHQFYLL